MLAHLRDQRKRCSRCGTHEDEADEILEHYQPDLFRCKVCEKTDARMLDKRRSGGSMAGLSVKLYPISSREANDG